MPLWVQLRERILGITAASRPGERLFTDDELAERFGVHRLTVRQAVQDLVHAGILYRIRGVGTFAVEPAVRSRFRAVEQFFSEWSGQGLDIDVELLGYEWCDCSEAIADRLGVPEGDPVLFIGRRRWVNDEPIAVDQRYIPERYAQGIRRADVVARPLFETIAQRVGVAVTDGHNELQATRAGDNAEMLSLSPEHPVLLRRLVLLTDTRQPVLTGTTVYRGDRFVYRFGGDIGTDLRFQKPYDPVSADDTPSG